MFLIRPMPYQGESLSSWRHRAGLANGFKRFPRPSGKYHRVDPDRLPDIEERDWLRFQMGISDDRISSSCVESIGFASDHVHGRNSKMQWLLPCVQSSRYLGAGPVYCPQCLATDADPYFRKLWRFAFVTHCPIHRCPMREGCPHCNAPIWPRAKRTAELKFWPSLSKCQWCGDELAAMPATQLAESNAITFLWNEPAPQGDTYAEYLAGVWVLCQSLLKRRVISKLTAIPLNLPHELITASAGRIELLPLSERELVLRVALWLIDDWPTRFINVMQRRGISLEHFSSNIELTPQWMRTEIAAHLIKRRRNYCSVTDVQRAVTQITCVGKPVSKAAVRLALGISESNAVHAALFQRRVGNTDDLLAILDRLDKQVLNAKETRMHRCALIRDYVGFLYSVVLTSSIEFICGLTKSELSARVANVKHRNTGLSTIVLERLAALDSIYACEVRPRLMASARADQPWLLSRYGKPILGHSIRQRISRMMQTGFSDILWKSCDVFQHILGTPHYGRRARRFLKQHDSE